MVAEILHLLNPILILVQFHMSILIQMDLQVGSHYPTHPLTRFLTNIKLSDAFKDSG